MFVTVHKDDPFTVRRNSGRGETAERGCDRARFASSQRLAEQSALGDEEDFPIPERECAAAVSDATGDIERRVCQIAWRLGISLRQQYAGLRAVFPPDERISRPIPLHITQADAARDRRAADRTGPSTVWFTHHIRLALCWHWLGIVPNPEQNKMPTYAGTLRLNTVA